MLLSLYLMQRGGLCLEILAVWTDHYEKISGFDPVFHTVRPEAEIPGIYLHLYTYGFPLRIKTFLNPFSSFTGRVIDATRSDTYTWTISSPS